MNLSLANPAKAQLRDALPDAADVVIIGGGVVGIFAGLYLNRSGLKVLICEKGRVAAEQSSRNWGWLRQQNRVEAELPIVMESVRRWAEVDAEVDGRCGFVQQGSIGLANTEASLTRRAEWLEISKASGLESRMLSRSEMDSLHDQAGGMSKWSGGILTPSDAYAEPWRAVPAVARLAHSEGLTIREKCAVRSLDIAGGTVVGVVTEDGRVACDQVILAGGAWSSLFACNHGISFPQLSVLQTVAQTSPHPSPFAGCVLDDEFAYRPRSDGGYTIALSDTNFHYPGPDSFRGVRPWLPTLANNWQEIGLRPAAPTGFPDAWGTKRRWREGDSTPFERMRVLNPAPNQSALKKICNRFAHRFPDIGAPKLLSSWAGMVDALPDGVPIVDRVHTMPGLIVATGMSGHGFVSGPGFGKIAADLARNIDPEHCVQRFRLDRFTDGTKLIPAPKI